MTGRSRGITVQPRAPASLKGKWRLCQRWDLQSYYGSTYRFHVYDCRID